MKSTSKFVSIRILKSQSSKSTQQIGIRHLFLSTLTLLEYFGNLIFLNVGTLSHKYTVRFKKPMLYYMCIQYTYSMANNSENNWVRDWTRDDMPHHYFQFSKYGEDITVYIDDESDKLVIVSTITRTQEGQRLLHEALGYLSTRPDPFPSKIVITASMDDEDNLVTYYTTLGFTPDGDPDIYMYQVRNEEGVSVNGEYLTIHNQKMEANSRDVMANLAPLLRRGGRKTRRRKPKSKRKKHKPKRKTRKSKR